MSGPYITKGTHVTAQWFGNTTLPSLSGMQMKLQVTQFVVSGVCRHFRGDHPTNPTQVKVYIDPDPECNWKGKTVRPIGCTCENEHVEINPDHIVRVKEPVK